MQVLAPSPLQHVSDLCNTSLSETEFDLPSGISIKMRRVPTYFLGKWHSFHSHESANHLLSRVRHASTGKYVLNISLIVIMALATLVFDNGSENVFCVPVACFMGIVRLTNAPLCASLQTPASNVTLFR